MPTPLHKLSQADAATYEYIATCSNLEKHSQKNGLRVYVKEFRIALESTKYTVEYRSPNVPFLRTTVSIIIMWLWLVCAHTLLLNAKLSNLATHSSPVVHVHVL